MPAQNPPGTPRLPAGNVDSASSANGPARATGSFDGPAHTPARALLAHFGRWAGGDVDEVVDSEASESAWYGPNSTGKTLLATIEHLPLWAEDHDTTESQMALNSDRTSATAVAPREKAADIAPPDQPREIPPFAGPRSTGRSLLEHLKNVPKWSGDDLEERLDEVVRARGKVKF